MLCMKSDSSLSYGVFDISKFIAAILVVAIHCSSSYEINNDIAFFFINVIGRLAVPFFFCVSGFLISKKNIEDWDIVKNYIKRLIQLYLVWSIVYLPVNIYLVVTKEKIFIGILDYLKDIFFVGSFIPLWYFPALIFGVLVIHFLMKKLSITKVMAISFFIFVIGLFGDAYYGLLFSAPKLKNIYDMYLLVFETTRNGLFFGMFFISLGIYLQKKRKSGSIKRVTLGLIFSTVLLTIEVFVLKYYNVALDYNMLIFTIPSIYFIFLLLINIKLENKPIYLTLRKMSILIFGSHCIMRGAMYLIGHFLKINIINEKFIYHFLGTTALSILFSFILLHHFKKIKI